MSDNRFQQAEDRYMQLRGELEGVGVRDLRSPGSLSELRSAGGRSARFIGRVLAVRLFCPECDMS